MIEKFALSLALTLFFELAYAAFWGLRGRDQLLVAGMNVLTNPLVVLWYSLTAGSGFLISTLLPELIAVAAEAWLLCRFGKNVTKPILLAVCINAFSYTLGLLVNYLL